MEYRRLGDTGLKVSVIGYGNWLNADSPQAIENNKLIVKRAWELGINFFDTAEIYGYGQGEIQLGEALKALNVPRQDIVLTTKIFFGDSTNPFPNSRFLSRKHIIEGLKNSLNRLQTTYVDVVYAHRFDEHTPMEEICRAFDWTIRHGYAHYWGTSEWSAQQITEAIGVCQRLRLYKPVVEQPQYNMFTRDRFEWEYEGVFAAGYGSTVWSPLFQGVLCGKYNDDVNALGRFKNMQDNPFVKSFFERNLANKESANKLQAQLKGLGDIAKELNISQSQLAMAWVIKNKDVSTAITGVTKIEQLEDTINAVKHYKLITPEIEKKIEAILQNKPQTVLNFKLGAPYPTRRDLFV